MIEAENRESHVPLSQPGTLVSFIEPDRNHLYNISSLRAREHDVTSPCQLYSILII
jgi:hypothetical protein